MLEDFKKLSSKHIIALLVFFLVMLGYTAAVTAAQHRSFEEHAAQSVEMVAIMGSDGIIRQVPKADYEHANEQWRQEHPEDYGVSAQ